MFRVLHTPGPRWPSEMESFDSLLRYLNHKDTITLAKSLYGVNFHEPTYGSYGPDESAYTLDDTQTTFCCTMFGQEKAYDQGHRTFFVQASDEWLVALRSVWDSQLRVLAAPITADHDNDHRSADTRVVRWMDGDHYTGVGAHAVKVHLDHISTTRCRVWMPDEDELLVETRPLIAGDFPMQVGDLVLFEASLHRRDDRSGTTPRFKPDIYALSGATWKLATEKLCLLACHPAALRVVVHLLVTRTIRRRLRLMQHATTPAGRARKRERCSVEHKPGRPLRVTSAYRDDTV
ncbi:hypothetical protein B0H17DRAFT_1136406 [Mycena rosella]|uniref:Uncharacterized protein n=1 Tax=Mycena rosella TaxID=1033263 RepID=A0AAD7DAY4_MYCRO|nr:hypothetical protein B0H17DRAFT_1136406 [Mycena rosella]